MKIIHPPVVRDFDIPVQQDGHTSFTKGRQTLLVIDRGRGHELIENFSDQPDAWHPVRIDITPNNPHTTKGRKASKR